MRPISWSVYDRLLAIGALITKFGSISDSLHYGLSERSCAMLPSRRLAISSGKYEEALEEYSGAHALGEISRSREYFSRHWDSRRGGRHALEADSLFDEFETATQCEFGFTLTELIAFLSEAFQLGKELTGEPRVSGVDTFLAQMDTRLRWDAIRVREAFELFSARPRRDYLSPPRPFIRLDVLPWRYNRALSYIRKPFLIRETDAGHTALWGQRHLYQAGRYLVDLVIGGRLKAQSAEMKAVQGKCHNRDGVAFSDAVADAYRAVSGLVVRSRVEKIGKLKIARPSGQGLGDIDVLVAFPASRKIIVTEAKDFAVALTPIGS